MIPLWTTNIFRPRWCHARQIPYTVKAPAAGATLCHVLKKEPPKNKRCLYEMPEKTKPKTICNKCLMPVSPRIGHY
ncbi:hypothetical protein [uncultured Chryseobacterium sp.]|uniref:hypothetical protein n=1 Tax=uncultured Chryseobacterium sp. TaxID=259322 RepID=UPI0025E55D4C|nr:hypothetical protein [uncultured Chryseobacterium sp.]